MRYWSTIQTQNATLHAALAPQLPRVTTRCIYCCTRNRSCSYSSRVEDQRSRYHLTGRMRRRCQPWSQSGTVEKRTRGCCTSLNSHPMAVSRSQPEEQFRMTRIHLLGKSPGMLRLIWHSHSRVQRDQGSPVQFQKQRSRGFWLHSVYHHHTSRDAH